MLPITAPLGRWFDVDEDADALAASAASVGTDEDEDEDADEIMLTLTGLAASGFKPPPSLPFDPSGGSLDAPPILGRGPPRDASGFARVIVAGRPGGVFGGGLSKSSSSSSSSKTSSSKPRLPIALGASSTGRGGHRQTATIVLLLFGQSTSRPVTQKLAFVCFQKEGFAAACAKNEML